MRKVLISILLASAAASSAIAGPHNFSRQSTQEDRQSAREDRQAAREERQSAREDRQPAVQERSQARQEAPRQQPAANFGGGQSNRGDRAAQQFQGQQFQGGQQAFQRRSAEDRRADRANARGYQGNAGNDYVAPGPRVVTQGADAREQRAQARALRQSSRETPNVIRDRHPLVVSDTPRPGTQPPLRTDSRNHNAVQWNTNWRHDGHHDWHGYRNRHRSLFHLGFYYDPYGWGYQPFSIGWRLWPGYYGRNYWINNPWMYQLPYAPAGYAWVRYWNDALLVDTWTGTVVDVIPGFFW